jgi:hypothetical protein
MSSRRNSLISLAVAIVVVTACGEASEPTLTARGPASSSPERGAPARTGATTSLATKPAGRAIDTPVGRVTVGGVTDLGSGTARPNARVVEIEVCSSQGVPFSPASFLLETDDGRSWSPSPPATAVRQPDLATVVQPSPPPGSCARGWLTFDVDSAQRSTAVLFHAPRSDETFTWPAG